MYWLMLDAIILLLCLLGFYIYYRKGLLAAAVGIIGGVAALLLAFWASDRLTPFVYESVVKDKLLAQVEQKIQDSGGVATMLDENSIIAALFGKEESSNAADAPAGPDAENATGVSETIVEGTVGSTVRNIVHSAIAIAVFIAAIIVINLLVGILRTANKVPLLGPLNKILGGVLGLAVGALWCYIFVSVCALFIKSSGDTLTWLNSEIVDRTFLFSLIYPHNLLNVIAAAVV
ncbi:MAG: CvpA family protein [Oscillospiraceae bacterium]